MILIMEIISCSGIIFIQESTRVNLLCVFKFFLNL